MNSGHVGIFKCPKCGFDNSRLPSKGSITCGSCGVRFLPTTSPRPYTPIFGLMKGFGALTVLAFLVGLAMALLGGVPLYQASKSASESSELQKAKSEAYIANPAWAERVDDAHTKDLDEGDTKHLSKLAREARYEAKVFAAAEYADVRLLELEAHRVNVWLATVGAKLAGGAFLAMIAASILIRYTRPPAA
jgi:hypothetical protein